MSKERPIAAGAESRLKKIKDLIPDIKMELLKKQIENSSKVGKSIPAWVKRRQSGFMRKAQGGGKKQV